MLLTRRDYLKASTLLLGTSALPHRLFSQSNADKLAELKNKLIGPVKLTNVASNVSMISGSGGNIGLLTGPEGKLVVDSGLSDNSSEVLKAISQVDAQPLKYLVNTHFHFDHTNGNAPIHAAGAAIVAHQKTRTRMSSVYTMDLMKIQFPAAPAAALPTRTLTDSFTLFHSGEEVVLQHVAPAHTDTDLYVHFRQANVIHAGDLFFNGAYPVIDYSSGGNINGYLDGMSKVLAAANESTQIIPGHGPLATKRDLTVTHHALTTIRDRVAESKRSGKSLAETIAAKPTAEFDAKMGRGMLGPDVILTLIYNTLA